MHTCFQVTDCHRPITAAKDRAHKGHLTCFGPNISKLIKHMEIIQQIESLLVQAPGFDIVERNGNYVLDGSLEERVERFVQLRRKVPENSRQWKQHCGKRA